MKNKPPGKLSEFSRPECEWLRHNCNFTEDELAVFNLRARDKSLVQIQFELGMSESTVTRKIRAIKKKIYKVI